MIFLKNHFKVNISVTMVTSRLERYVVEMLFYRKILFDFEISKKKTFVIIRCFFFFFEKEICFDIVLWCVSKDGVVIMQGTWVYIMRSHRGLAPNKCHYDRKMRRTRSKWFLLNHIILMYNKWEASECRDPKLLYTP